jgi:UDP-glucose 4-epimerase
MNKRVFVSGGAGFIGSHLVDRLISTGQIVTVYDNLSSGKNEFFSQHHDNPNFKFIKADLLDLDSLKAAIKGHDLVFHLAANPDIRYGIEHTDTDLKQNTVVTYNVLEAMRVNNVKEIAFSSTSTIYGEPKVMPTPEDYGPLFPISLYGASKLACEALCTSFAHTFGMKCWIYRFANIVGGRATHGIIFDFLNKLKKNNQELEILGNGRQTKSYLLVDDCISAMLYVYEHSKEQFNVFNLGCEDRMDITSIANILINKMGLRQTKLRFTGGERGWPGDVPQMSLAVEN